MAFKEYLESDFARTPFLIFGRARGLTKIKMVFPLIYKCTWKEFTIELTESRIPFKATGVRDPLIDIT